jgi:hypothetical protein
MGSTPRGISASRGAAVLGLSEYMTPLEVWQRICEEREPGFNEKHGYILPEKPDSAAMRWGTAFEGAIIELAEGETGKRILDRETFFSVNGYGDEPFFERRMGNELANYITCHIDGAYDDNDGTPYTLHEGKSTSAIVYREKWGQPGTDHIPRSYQVQVQHQMLCAGAEEDIVSVLEFPKTPDAWESEGWKIEPIEAAGVTVNYRLIKYVDGKAALHDIFSPSQWADIFRACGYFHQYPVKANPAAQKRMVEIYREFWHNHVLTGKPPEPRNYEDIKRLFVEPVGTIVCDAAMTAWWREYDAIRKEIGSSGNAKKRQDKLRLRILERARKMDAVLDDESREKVVFRDSEGNKLGQYSKGVFR